MSPEPQHPTRKARGEEGVRELYEREVYVPESGMGELVRDDTVAAALGLMNSPQFGAS